MTITRTGSTLKYAEGWEAIFTGKSNRGKRKASKATTAKTKRPKKTSTARSKKAATAKTAAKKKTTSRAGKKSSR